MPENNELGQELTLSQSVEASVGIYLTVLKTVKQHCPEDENYLEIADRIFIDMQKASSQS